MNGPVVSKTNNGVEIEALWLASEAQPPAPRSQDMDDLKTNLPLGVGGQAWAGNVLMGTIAHIRKIGDVFEIELTTGGTVHVAARFVVAWKTPFPAAERPRGSRDDLVPIWLAEAEIVEAKLMRRASPSGFCASTDTFFYRVKYTSGLIREYPKARTDGSVGTQEPT